MPTQFVPDTDEVAVLQERVSQLEAALNQNNLDIAVTFGLTPALSNLLGLLLALPLVTAEAIQEYLEIATDRKVAICRLRKCLKPWNNRLGLSPTDEIIQSQRYMGYWIEPKVKRRLKDFVYEQIGLPELVSAK